MAPISAVIADVRAVLSTTSTVGEDMIATTAPLASVSAVETVKGVAASTPAGAVHLYVSVIVSVARQAPVISAVISCPAALDDPIVTAQAPPAPDINHSPSTSTSLICVGTGAPPFA